MDWLHTNWKPYALRMGLLVLKGDLDHITRSIGKVRQDRQKAVMKEYVNVWLKAAGDPINQNKGRFAANQYMLEL